MRFRFLVFLSLGLILFPFAFIACDDSEAEIESDPIFILISYRTDSGLHLQLLPNSSNSCFENVVLYAFSGESIVVTVDGESSVYSSSYVLSIPFSFVPGEEHTIAVSSGDFESEWDLKVRSRISITDFDRDVDEIVSMTSADYNSKMLFSAATGFFVTAVGIFVSYRFARYRASHGVREL